MKFSEFKNNSEMLANFGLKVERGRFINFDEIPPINLPHWIMEDLEFVLTNRGDTDMEFYACEFLIGNLAS